MITIDRCICQGMSFAVLLQRVREHGWQFDELVEHTGCGGQCGLCRPYLRRMLRDGTTVFHQLLDPDGETD